MVQEHDAAPPFELPAEDGSLVRLADLRGERVILFFYPKADTPGCTAEACEFRDLQPQITEAGATLLGISPDSVQAQKKFRDRYDLPFRLLADEEHAVAEAYGVWTEKPMYGRQYMGVERSTFVIDADGRIERAYRGVKPEGHAAGVLGAL
jgi:peroxiredoxin Q/BCP